MFRHQALLIHIHDGAALNSTSLLPQNVYLLNLLFSSSYFIDVVTVNYAFLALLLKRPSIPHQFSCHTFMLFHLPSSLSFQM